MISPLVWLMAYAMAFFEGIFHSIGFSAITLGFFFSGILLPLRRWLEMREKVLRNKINNIKKDVDSLSVTLKGEERFHATEKIYENYGFHPIQAIRLGGSFFVMIPILIAAIFLFADGKILTNESFWIIQDLSRPDNILFGINGLPILLLIINLVDVEIFLKNDSSSKTRFAIIALIVFALVYNMPAGIVLYWIGANLFSLCSRFIPSYS